MISVKLLYLKYSQVIINSFSSWWCPSCRSLLPLQKFIHQIGCRTTCLLWVLISLRHCRCFQFTSFELFDFFSDRSRLDCSLNLFGHMLVYITVTDHCLWLSYWWLATLLRLQTTLYMNGALPIASAFLTDLFLERLGIVHLLDVVSHLGWLVELVLHDCIRIVIEGLLHWPCRCRWTYGTSLICCFWMLSCPVFFQVLLLFDCSSVVGFAAITLTSWHRSCWVHVSLQGCGVTVVPQVEQSARLWDSNWLLSTSESCCIENWVGVLFRMCHGGVITSARWSSLRLSSEMESPGYELFTAFMGCSVVTEHLSLIC